jgi:hypothetical protein
MNDPRMQTLTMPAVLSPAEIRTGLEEDFSDSRIQAVEELKHAIRTHVVLMNGVSDQLGAYLLKLIDFLTDNNEDRRIKEIGQLAYNISEAVSLYVSGIIDSHINRNEAEKRPVSEDLKRQNDEVLVEIGKWRSNADKLAAKNAVLAAMAKALNMFSIETGMQYPQLVGVDGTPL